MGLLWTACESCRNMEKFPDRIDSIKIPLRSRIVLLIIKRASTFVGMIFALASCTFPAKPTGFLKEPPKMTKDESTSYQRSWTNSSAGLSKYRKVYLAPVALHGARLRNMAWNSRNLTGRKEADLKMMSQSLRCEFATAFSESPNGWRVLNQPSKEAGAIGIELNVVEVVASRPVVELIGKLIPGGGILNRPSMAIEGRVIEMKSGKVLAKFADREKPSISLLSISKLQYYKAHRNLMRDWAGQTVKWIERTNPKEKVWEVLPFTLIDF